MKLDLHFAVRFLAEETKRQYPEERKVTEKTLEQQIQEAAQLYLAAFFVLSDSASYNEEKQKIAQDYCRRTKEFLLQHGYQPDQIKQSASPRPQAPGKGETAFIYPDIILGSQNGKGLLVEGEKINAFIEHYFPRQPVEPIDQTLLSSRIKKH